MLTTYDFTTKSFGHATMLVGPMAVFVDGYAPGRGIPGDCDGDMQELADARERLKMEIAKREAGEPFDFFFVNGYEPTSGISDGCIYDHVGGRLWRRLNRPLAGKSDSGGGGEDG